MERLIFVENLYPDVDAYLLSREFVKFGKILSVSIDYDDQYVSLCRGQVVYQNPSSAKAALKMNGIFTFGRPLTVKSAGRKTNIKSIYSNYTKIFVKNLDLDWDECDLSQHFSDFGEIVEANVSMTDDKSNGYGFIKFKQHSSAKKAVESMNDKVVGNKVLKVEAFVPRDVREELNSKSLDHAKDLLQKSTQKNNLHVKNLPKNIDEEELIRLFEKFGEVTSVKIVKNGNQSRGFGFVAFKSEKEAETARFRMNGYSLNSQILEVNFNQGKEERQRYLQLLKNEPQMKKSFNENIKPTRGKSVESSIRAREPLFSFSSNKY